MKDIFKKKDFSDPDFSKSIKDVDKKTGIVTGYFAAFNNVDLGGDMIEPGAFTKTIGERGPQGANRIQFLNQHDTWQNLGKPQVLKEDNYGLYHESKISQTTLGKDALILLEDNVLDSFSIGYRVTTENIVNDVNHLKEIYLYEGSLVTFPMNESAIVTGLKGIDPEQLERKIKQLEKFCRDTAASDDTIELLLIHIKQMQQVLVELATTTPPPEEDTEPGKKEDKTVETLIREVNNMRIISEITNFSKSLKSN